MWHAFTLYIGCHLHIFTRMFFEIFYCWFVNVLEKVFKKGNIVGYTKGAVTFFIGALVIG